MQKARTQVFPLLLLGLFLLPDPPPSMAQILSLPFRMDVVGRGNQGDAQISIDNGPLGDVPIQDTLIHLRSDTSSSCIATASVPCNYTIELLKLNVGPTSFQGVGISSVELRNGGFIPIQVFQRESGPTAVLPTRLEISATGVSDMGVVTGFVTVQADLVMIVDPAGDTLQVIGTIDGSVGGRSFHAFINIGANGPLLNRPPVAKAQSTLVIQPQACTTSVRLDGSASTDPNNDIVSWMWTEGRYTIGSGQQVDVPRVATGVHTFTLLVTDSFGGQDSNSVSVSVNPSVKPVISNALTVTASSCKNVVLVPPAVTHPCGLTTTLVSNAPLQFRAGRTIVRWTATDELGNTSFVDQDVVVNLGDDASCCPVGSRLIRGTSNNDHLEGTPAADCILGFGGQDRIFGKGGDDVVSAGDGDDFVSGGGGNDTIACGAGQDLVHGDDGNDSISGNDGDDSLFGDAGNDMLEGGQGQDHLTGGSGNDVIHGGEGDDTISAGSGDDFIDAGPGNDRAVSGEAGNDVVLGRDGDDVLTGGDGGDSLDGGNGRDTCVGGSGSNTLLTCEVIQ